ncbi:hypothetical protein HMPREF0202_00121 [Cetobacterium somerae ATCC BAA-474]|uniref:DUF4032 domain-containing protein n=2 Tax=Cetobacterium TaxID=180162 RepID=U7VGH2_9FUSO|nr:ParB N-terminal domain-containing protein [Cetobacterium somerae]ERT69918.1 hypothetical protein HMPREF0202_00121 [Cetobacterium somerae ATCC BAA-474]
MKFDIDKEEAEIAFKKALRKTRFNFFDRENRKIKEFSVVEKENQLSNKIYLGVKEVPVVKIVGTVEKAQDFDKDFNPLREESKGRWSSVYIKYLESGSLPPVILYKVREEYYVYDGNHRISVAKNLNFHSIEAEVYEFFSQNNEEIDKLSRERFSFEKESGLSNIECSKVENYKELREEVRKFLNLYFLGEENFEKAIVWYQRVFTPIVSILISNFKNLENENNGDIFVEYLKYKNTYRLGNKYQRGYTNTLIDYLNRNKILLLKDLKTDISLDSFLIDDFRKLYYIDKIIFYTDDTKGKIKAIREYSKKQFRRETLIIGEIALFNLVNDIPGFIIGMQRWFEQVYNFYKEEIILKSKQLSLTLDGLNLEEIVEDCIRYSRYYRKKEDKLLTKKELIYSYILDIYLPIFIMFQENELEKNRNKQYLKISQSYLYYTRYGGLDNLREFIEKNIVNKEEYKIGDFTLSKNIKLDYNLDKELESYWSLKDYGGTQNYETIYRLKEYIKFLNIKTLEEINKKFKEDIEKLIKNREILIQYNNSRVLNVVKGKWEQYTFIDYYGTLV